MLTVSLRAIHCGCKTYVSLLTNNFLWGFLGENSLIVYICLILRGFSFPCWLSQTVIFTSFLPITAIENLLCNFIYLFIVLFTYYWVNQLWNRNFVHPQTFGILWELVISLLMSGGLCLVLSEMDAMMRTGWLWCRTALSSDTVNGHWSPSCLN